MTQMTFGFDHLRRADAAELVHSAWVQLFKAEHEADTETETVQYMTWAEDALRRAGAADLADRLVARREPVRDLLGRVESRYLWLLIDEDHLARA